MALPQRDPSPPQAVVACASDRLPSTSQLMADTTEGQPLRDYWAERCMYEVMKLESNIFERIEQLEQSFESRHNLLEERLQPSGSAAERYKALDGAGPPRLSEGSCTAEVAAAIEDIRTELQLSQQNREVELEVTRRELSVDLKQGFDRLRADLSVQFPGDDSLTTKVVSEKSQVEPSDTVMYTLSQRLDSSEKQFVDLQQQRTETELAIRDLSTRLEAAERASFDVDEPASLVKRIATLESYSNSGNRIMVAMNSVYSRLEELERKGSKGSSLPGIAEGSNPDMQFSVEAMKAALEKTQQDVIEVAQGLNKEITDRHEAIKEFDGVCHVVARAAASAIERLESLVPCDDLLQSLPSGDISPSTKGALHALSAVANASSSHVSPSAGAAGQSAGSTSHEIRIRSLEARASAMEERLNRELVIQLQRLEMVDSNFKAALKKGNDKIQAACEIATRTLLLEKAVKGLQGGGQAESLSRPVSADRPSSPTASLSSLPSPKQMRQQRMYSTGVLPSSPSTMDRMLSSSNLSAKSSVERMLSCSAVPASPSVERMYSTGGRPIVPTLSFAQQIPSSRRTEVFRSQSLPVQPLPPAATMSYSPVRTNLIQGVVNPMQNIIAEACTASSSVSPAPQVLESDGLARIRSPRRKPQLPTSPRLRHHPSSPDRSTAAESSRILRPHPKVQQRAPGRAVASSPRQQAASRGIATRRSQPGQLFGTGTMTINSPRQSASPRDLMIFRESHSRDALAPGSNGGSPRLATRGAASLDRYHWISPRNSVTQQDGGHPRGRSKPVANGPNGQPRPQERRFRDK